MGNISLTNAPWLSPRSRQENQENSEGLGLQPLIDFLAQRFEMLHED